MNEEIVAKAEFLLTELHLSPVEAQKQLRYWFPELEREERVRYVHSATMRGTGRHREAPSLQSAPEQEAPHGREAAPSGGPV
ncbi:hypothetical protein [Kitasatospora sp. HPMI-4]|uniref:hypothetical protein n=1 Tax=Kitasatospora sp. HPMI-4 TaxID=3448443 RepID=UPI003F1B07AD